MVVRKWSIDWGYLNVVLGCEMGCFIRERVGRKGEGGWGKEREGGKNGGKEGKTEEGSEVI